jgi:HPt (histidine-containing phosphotransfer) domain-containing protein/HAMP domain-containing protein
MILVSNTLNSSNKSKLLRELDRTTEKSDLAREMRRTMLEMGIAMRNIGLLTEPLKMQVQEDKVKTLRATYTQARDKLAARGLDDAEKKVLEEITKLDKATEGLLKEALGQSLAFNPDGAIQIIIGKIDPLSLELLAAINRLVDIQVAAGKEALEHSVAADRTLTIVLSVLGVVAVAMGAGFGWRITRSVTIPITTMQSEMTEIATNQDFSRRVPIDHMDEVGLSLVAFNSMIEKIQESSTQLKQKTADIQAMMQNIPQGILTIQGGNKVHPEFSAYLATILETKDIAGRDVMDLIFSNSQCNAEIQSQVEAAISASIGEDAMNFEFNDHLLVREVEKKMPDGRVKILDLSWSPITNDMDSVVSVMLCVRDISEIKQLAAEAGAQKRELDIIGQILAINQEKFHEFIDSSAKFLSENKQIIDEVGKDIVRVEDPEVITQLFRNMHTIKGNARTYGLLHLTNMVHEAEQAYDQLRKDPDADWDQEKLLDQLSSTFSAIQEYAHINETKLGRKGPGRRGGVEKFLMVQIEDIQQAIKTLDHVDWSNAASVRNAVTQVHNSLSLIGTERVDSVLAGIADSLPSLAKELGKEPPNCTIQDHGIVIKTQVADLVRNVFMHLYRNSMDHGIETAAERVANGKPAAGSIQLDLSMSDDKLRFKLRDDGRGLAVNFIRDKAIEKGLITPEQQLSPEETAQLIFKPGFSTATKVTEVSGRGVGMDAVKSFVEREHGSIELRFLDSPTAILSDGYRPFETVITLPAKLAVQDANRSQVG